MRGPPDFPASDSWNGQTKWFPKGGVEASGEIAHGIEANAGADSSGELNLFGISTPLGGFKIIGVPGK